MTMVINDGVGRAKEANTLHKNGALSVVGTNGNRRGVPRQEEPQTTDLITKPPRETPTEIAGVELTRKN